MMKPRFDRGFRRPFCLLAALGANERTTAAGPVNPMAHAPRDFA